MKLSMSFTSVGKLFGLFWWDFMKTMTFVQVSDFMTKWYLMKLSEIWKVWMSKWLKHQTLFIKMWVMYWDESKDDFWFLIEESEQKWVVICIYFLKIVIGSMDYKWFFVVLVKTLINLKRKHQHNQQHIEFLSFLHFSMILLSFLKFHLNLNTVFFKWLKLIMFIS